MCHWTMGLNSDKTSKVFLYLFTHHQVLCSYDRPVWYQLVLCILVNTSWLLPQVNVQWMNVFCVSLWAVMIVWMIRRNNIKTVLSSVIQDYHNIVQCNLCSECLFTENQLVSGLDLVFIFLFFWLVSANDLSFVEFTTWVSISTV